MEVYQFDVVLVDFDISKEFGCFLRRNGIYVAATTKFKPTKSNKLGHKSNIPVIIW